MGDSPSSAERILKLSIALVVLVFLLAPMMILLLRVGVPSASNDIYTRIFGKPGDPGDIATGSGSGNVDKLEAGLLDLTAYTGEAKGSASALHIVALRFKEANSSDQRGFYSVDLDLVAAEGTAVVAFAYQPIRWRVMTIEGAHRARFGVESVVPFQVVDAKPGLLSGYRVAAFGAGPVAHPLQYIEGHEAERFCMSIKRWREFYGLKPSQVRLSAVSDPGAILVSPYGLVNTGNVIGGLPPIDVFCRRY